MIGVNSLEGEINGLLEILFVIMINSQKCLLSSGLCQLTDYGDEYYIRLLTQEQIQKQLFITLCLLCKALKISIFLKMSNVYEYQIMFIQCLWMMHLLLLCEIYINIFSLRSFHCHDGNLKLFSYLIKRYFRNISLNVIMNKCPILHFIRLVCCVLRPSEVI